MILATLDRIDGAPRGDRDVLSCYETMAVKSKAMLAAARQSDWDAVVALERDCATIIAGLQAQDDARPSLNDDERRRKGEIIRALLADDAEIRNLAQPWLAELQSILATTRAQQRVGRAYG